MKTKNKNKKKHPAFAKASAGKYPAWVLAVILLAVLLLMGGLSKADAADWSGAMSVLDIHVSRLPAGRQVTPGLFQPVVDVVTDVNKFYHSASDEMYYLLEGETFPEVAEVISAVDEFYNQATNEMMAVLDISEQGRVAGISIEK